MGVDAGSKGLEGGQKVAAIKPRGVLHASASHYLVLLFSTALILVTACSSDPDPAEVPAASNWTEADPTPEPVGDSVEVPSGGGVLDLAGDVTVTVPTGASSAAVEVRAGKDIGRFGDELFGRPVHVDHERELAKPVTVSWPVGDLPRDQLRAAMLVHFDEELEVWVPVRGELRLVDNRLVAHVKDFSWIDWVAGVGQGVGEVGGSRVDEPSCSGEPLPSWVEQTVDPDEDLSAAAIRVCFERDKDERVTVRVADNRTFTQRLIMRDGGQEWAWTWPGKDAGVGISATVADVARQVFDSKTTFLVPALDEVAIGIARPAQPGGHVIRVEATVDAVTVLVDVVDWAANNISPGGLANPLANSFLQALYECGGQELLDGVPTDAAGVVRVVVEAIGSCASDITRWDSEFGARFEKLVQRQIRNHPGETAENWAKANRLVRGAAHAFKIIEVGKVAFYVSDQFANALVGNLSFSIRGRGTAQPLGGWVADCTEAAVDSNRLYRNLALRDEFADTSKELWQFPAWSDQAKRAVEPLAGCDAVYLRELAAFLPSDWGDPKAAGVAGDAILALVPPDARVPTELQGSWCTSDQSQCVNFTELLDQYPDAFFGESSTSDEGSTSYTFCLSNDLGDLLGSPACTTAGSMYFEYFPVGVGWDCVAHADDWQSGCDPDYSSEHDTSMARVVQLLNHQQGTAYVDSPPMYATNTVVDAGTATEAGPFDVVEQLVSQGFRPDQLGAIVRNSAYLIILFPKTGEWNYTCNWRIYRSDYDWDSAAADFPIEQADDLVSLDFEDAKSDYTLRGRIEEIPLNEVTPELLKTDSRFDLNIC